MRDTVGRTRRPRAHPFLSDVWLRLMSEAASSGTPSAGHVRSAAANAAPRHPRRQRRREWGGEQGDQAAVALTRYTLAGTVASSTPLSLSARRRVDDRSDLNRSALENQRLVLRRTNR